MSEPSVLTKQCPVCQAKPVQQIRGPKGFGSPTHSCASCGSLLKPVITARAMLSLPIGAAIFCFVYLAISWLNQSIAITGSVRAALLGGLGAFFTATVLWYFMRGMVFRVVKQ